MSTVPFERVEGYSSSTVAPQDFVACFHTGTAVFIIEL